MGFFKGNWQTDKKLRAGYNVRVGMALELGISPELGTVPELVGLAKRDMHIACQLSTGMKHMRGCWKGKEEAKSDIKEARRQRD